ncbi:MAG: hypothetical protein AAF433_02180 [Bacteroidota bacterium]
MKPLASFGLLGLLLGLTACQSEHPLNYLPTNAQLRAGIYNKYYLHYQPDERDDWDTDISYLGYQRRNEASPVTLTTYNPSLAPTREQLIEVDRDSWHLLTEKQYFRTGDTSRAAIEGGTIHRLTADSCAPTSIRIEYPNGYVVTDNKAHLPPRDTLIDHYSGIVLPSYGTRKVELADSTIREFDFQMEEVLLAGIGLYSRQFSSEEYNFTWELMEQIPATAFRRMLAEAPKRIGYINPQEALEGPGMFSTCGSENEIYDYYNGDPDGQPLGGKPVLWQIVEDQWEPDLFTGLNGYLSLHFVINCRGEIGRFDLEQTNLDFQPTTFPTEAVRHCMQLLEQVPAWQPMVYQGEATDSYAYVTFKLNNGALIDIIP